MSDLPDSGMNFSWIRYLNALNKGAAYFIIVAVLLLFLAGLFSTVQCALKLRFSDWKPVEAVIKSSGKYSYTVNDGHYDNDKIWCCSGRLSHGETSALVNKFKAQQPLIVYYRSTDPSDSFYLPGHPVGEPWRMIAISGSGSVIILGFLIFYFIKWRRELKA